MLRFFKAKSLVFLLLLYSIAFFRGRRHSIVRSVRASKTYDVYHVVCYTQSRENSISACYYLCCGVVQESSVQYELKARAKKNFIFF